MIKTKMVSSTPNKSDSESLYKRLYVQAYRQVLEIAWQLAREENPSLSFEERRAWAKDIAQRFASDHVRLQLG